MRLTFLGTGGSWPTRRRGSQSIALTYGSGSILIDCGEGTQRQLVQSPVSPMRIRDILITHLHGDHFLGLPGLVQTMALNDRTETLNVWGPIGISRSWEMARAMCPFTEKFETKVHELKGGEVFQVIDLTVSCTAVKHSVPTLAYRIGEKDRTGRFHREKAVELGVPKGPLWRKLQGGENVTFKIDGRDRTVRPEQVLDPPRPGRSVVISGDTSPSEELIELARGADVLVHEATFTSDLAELADEVTHSTVAGAARIAKEAGVGKLVLVHSSPRYTKEESFERYLKEAGDSFKNVIVPEDLDVLDVTR
ncbi:MAG: ribonuclease Z [Thermoplasmatota archaeon]